MIDASEQVAAAVAAGGYNLSYVADVIVDGVRVLQNAPLSNVDVRWSADQKVRGTGRCVFNFTSEIGESIVPSDITSWFTPYATVLNLSARVTIGSFSENVLLGPLKIIRVTDPQDSRKPFQGASISIGSSVGLQLADLFRVTDKERFPAPFGPTDLSSVWDEIGRLTNLPLFRNAPDTEIPSSVTYKENRLDAVFDLAKVLGGQPFVDEFGRVAIEVNEWADPSPELGDMVIERLPADLTDDGIYNEVVVRAFQSSDGTILARKQLVDGPLRYGGTFGRVPFFASSQYVTTVEQAEAYAESELARVSQQPALQFALDVVPDPRRQVGDVVPFDWDGSAYLGRVREVNLKSVGAMRLRVESRYLGPVGVDVLGEFVGYGEGGYGEGGYGE